MKSHEHLQLSKVSSLNWDMSLSETTGKSPNWFEGRIMSQGLTMSDELLDNCVSVWQRVCTCRAPFLLKEDTHCMRRHISSATDSTILDRTRGTRSLETVNTWKSEMGTYEMVKKQLVNAGFQVQRTREMCRLFAPQRELWWCWPELPSGSSLHLREKKTQHDKVS